MDSCRRQYVRLPIRADALVELFAPLDITIRAVAMDISLGGACLETRSLETVDYLEVSRKKPELKVRMQLPYLKEPEEIAGRVRWARRTPEDETNALVTIGVQWVSLTREQAERMQYVVHRLSAEETQPRDPGVHTGPRPPSGDH